MTAAPQLDGQALGDIIAAEGGPLYIKLERVTLFNLTAGTTGGAPAMRLGAYAGGAPAMRLGAYAETAGGRPKPPRMFTPELLAAEGHGFPWLLRMLADELERAGVTGQGDGK